MRSQLICPKGIIVLISFLVPLFFFGETEGDVLIEELQHAAKENDADAQVNLALKYVFGIGVPQNYMEAFKLFTKAAEGGHARAQYFLGLMYIEDKGVPQDYVQAYKWWNLAATNGHEDAKNERDTISEIMTTEQIAEAKRLAEEWLEKHPN